ncbi:heat shock protein 30C-like [Tiliqua scincoides]|uniref:heat shock protein 30C-like n=1 Tax=Tiliqua scincoides TaxID=71010 RepID=UPI003462DF69
MAGLPRDGCRSPARRPSARRGCARALVEYVPGPVGLPPPSLLDELVCDVQRHLEEMERVRAALLDAYPCLAAARGRRGRRPSPAEDSADEDGAGAPYRFGVDVAGFAPEQLSVRLEGRRLTVTGKRERRADETDGCVSREYHEVRKELRLPADADLERLACTLAPDAQRLCVEAPRLPPPGTQRNIPIGLPGAPPAVEAPPAAPEPVAPAAAAA